MAERDPAELSRFVERFAQQFTDAGMPRIAARIFVALTATDDGRLTAAELAETLRASAGAISGGVRYLIQVELIRREREPGSRRDTYVVDDDVWAHTIGERDAFLDRWAQALRDGAEVLGEDTPAGRRYLESAEFFHFMGEELKHSLTRWRERQASRSAPAPEG